MATWNYRVVRLADARYTVTEVYYDDEGNPNGWVEDPGNVFDFCEDTEELGNRMVRLFRALDKPALKVDGNTLVPDDTAR